MEFTRTEIAERSGVSPQKVFRYLKDNNIEPISKIGKKHLYSESDAKKIINFFNSEHVSEELHTSNTKSSKNAKNGENIPNNNNELVELLKSQVSDLQKRLDARDKEVDQLHVLLSQAQQLTLSEQTKREALETSYQEQESIISELKNELDAKKNSKFKSFWSNFFK